MQDTVEVLLLLGWGSGMVMGLVAKTIGYAWATVKRLTREVGQ